MFFYHEYKYYEVKQKKLKRKTYRNIITLATASYT